MAYPLEWLEGKLESRVLVLYLYICYLFRRSPFFFKKRPLFMWPPMLGYICRDYYWMKGRRTGTHRHALFPIGPSIQLVTSSAALPSVIRTSFFFFGTSSLRRLESTEPSRRGLTKWSFFPPLSSYETSHFHKLTSRMHQSHLCRILDIPAGIELIWVYVIEIIAIDDSSCPFVITRHLYPTLSVSARTRFPKVILEQRYAHTTQRERERGK